ncbi:MAG: 30S ribosomal protein S8 [Nitrospinae bacterium CG11_big_fil_rev_8_21_14_0_20_45_15]|nr:MAG: 30S ribosomal protein S8 [Nitrospinae bacterium CG11_big_fil_rev_8_21_14_0_20_45_15]
MSMTDPIADYFTRIRNGLMVKKDRVEIPSSKLKTRISEILKEEGFIRNYRVFEDGKQGILRVYLKYKEGESVIRGIKRISTPGKRNYVSAGEVPRVLNGLGIALITTSSGVLTDEKCREKAVGGEVLGHVW